MWRYNCDRDPDEYFSSFIDALKDYSKEFEEGSLEAELIAAAQKEIDAVVDDLRSDEPEQEDGPQYRGSITTPNVTELRSIFDDVDQ